MDVHRVICVLALVTLGVAGCAGHRTLETKSAAVPAGVDLSGRWRLRGDGGDTKRRDGTLAVLAEETSAKLRAATDTHLMLCGGGTLEGPRIVWWNLVNSSRERIEQAKRDWTEGRFDSVPGDDEIIPLPD